jgi:hypothetical protein
MNPQDIAPDGAEIRTPFGSPDTFRQQLVRHRRPLKIAVW